jgi:hypothetical protein
MLGSSGVAAQLAASQERLSFMKFIYIYICSIKVIGKPWFLGLTLKTVLNLDLYWNKCTLDIKIETLSKPFYMYSTLFIEITQRV